MDTPVETSASLALCPCRFPPATHPDSRLRHDGPVRPRPGAISWSGWVDAGPTWRRRPRVTILDLDIAARPSAQARRIGPSRPTALLVIGLLTLLAVTASTPPAPPLLHALWSAAYDRDDDTVTLTPTSLYLYQHDAGAPTLKAYDLATGALRWSAPATGAFAQSPSVADGVLVAPDGYEKYFNRPDLLLTRTTRTIARDAHTGATLWRAAGAPVNVTDRSVLLLAAHTGGVDQLREVSLHDGHTLWSRPAPRLSAVVIVGDAV